MFQPQLINTVLVWDRILEIEDQKRKARRYEDVFTDEPTYLLSERAQPVNRQAWPVASPNRSQLSQSCCPQEHACETQLG